MSYKIRVSPTFKQEVKQISKKHKGITSDIAKLINELQDDPTKGTNLGQNVFKIRLAISGTNKGKSGGGRVITYVLIVDEIVILAAIYLKSDHYTIDPDILIESLKDQGLI